MHHTSFGEGRFRVIRLLGESAAGSVYEVHDAARGVRVALKTLHDDDPTAVARFKREFRVAQEVDHPGLVTLHELFAEGGGWFFTMDLIEGVDFLAYARPSGILSPERLRAATAQLVNALAALHARGRVHRDVKPTNVLVRADGQVVLLDFGFVSDRAASLTQDRILGTPVYMAPEQARAAAADPATDLYAVGVMLYEALVGRPPFDGAPLAILFAKQTQSAPSPLTVDPFAPADLAALCARLLETDPSARPATPEVLESLGHAATEVATAGSSPPPADRGGELEVLRAALQETCSGLPVTVLLEGPAGVGKRAILERFLASISRASTVVLRGRCHVRESTSFKGMDGVIESYVAHLEPMAPARVPMFLPTDIVALVDAFPQLTANDAGLRPVLEGTFALAFARARPADPQVMRLRAQDAVRDALARLANAVYVVIVVEDLQWADAGTQALLATLLAPERAPPILFVATVQAGAVDARDVRLPGDVRRVRVGA